jgi:hypothetical protein
LNRKRIHAMGKFESNVIIFVISAILALLTGFVVLVSARQRASRIASLTFDLT